MTPNSISNRITVSYIAFILHRISGLLLACFLPIHFFTLGLALEGTEPLNAALAFAEHPAVKLAEWGLVTIFTLHLLLGLRILIIEWMPWPETNGLRPYLAMTAIAVALLTGAVFIQGVWA